MERPLMKPAVALIALCVLAIPARTSAQTPEPERTESSSIPQKGPDFERPISWKLLIPNFFSDQQRIWTFPARLAQGQNLVATAAVLGTTAGLVGLDPIEGSYFRRTSTFNGFNRVFAGNATTIGTLVAPVSLYAVGLIRKDSKMQRTALLAGEAAANSQLLVTVLKEATRRLRPSTIPVGGNFSDTWFDSRGPVLRNGAGFPSGHAITAFSMATVVARRYGNHRWVPYVAYGLAAAVGFSRLSLSAHFLSDVAMGGALGYSIGRFVVLRQ